MKKNIFTIIVMIVVTATCMCFITSCGGSKLSGTYVPENPNDANIYFSSMEFGGDTVHLQMGTSNVGFPYEISDGEFSIKANANISIDGITPPKSLEYMEEKDGTFTLGGVHYIKEEDADYSALAETTATPTAKPTDIPTAKPEVSEQKPIESADLIGKYHVVKFRGEGLVLDGDGFEEIIELNENGVGILTLDDETSGEIDWTFDGTAVYLDLGGEDKLKGIVINENLLSFKDFGGTGYDLLFAKIGSAADSSALYGDADFK